jgi:hypothetical protein
MSIKRVGELLPAAPAKHGHHAVADRRRVAAQFADGFGRAALTELVDEFGGHALEHVGDQADSVDRLAPGDAGQEVVAAGLAEIGLQL